MEMSSSFPMIFLPWDYLPFALRMQPALVMLALAMDK